MKRDCDMIQFESRSEVGEILHAIEKYIEQNPRENNNKTLERLYRLLDIMEMEW